MPDTRTQPRKARQRDGRGQERRYRDVGEDIGRGRLNCFRCGRKLSYPIQDNLKKGKKEVWTEKRQRQRYPETELLSRMKGKKKISRKEDRWTYI